MVSFATFPKVCQWVIGHCVSLMQLTQRLRTVQIFTAPCLMVINLHGVYIGWMLGERERKLSTQMKSVAKNEKR